VKKKKKDPRVENNKRVRSTRRARANRREETSRQVNSQSFHPDQSIYRESNPTGSDAILVTVAFAHRHDVKMEQVRRAMEARDNPRFPCPDCGAIVRFGAGGGLYDVRLRAPHFKVCNLKTKATEEEIEEMRKLALAAAPLPVAGAEGDCLDCGFKMEHCRC
jgi:hypothetical protein